MNPAEGVVQRCCGARGDPVMEIFQGRWMQQPALAIDVGRRASAILPLYPVSWVSRDAKLAEGGVEVTRDIALGVDGLGHGPAHGVAHSG